ncbi:unnamed protein product [Adineta ricciae]|uniref:VWFA domain-containing protein n=1 Tax=Adineta ricciae TaxID=249248 RepID=A0A813WWW7_ADIRI|nr:unnamed protein product [Adineta ricciae]
MTAENELATIHLRCIPDNPNSLSGVLNTKKVRFDIETKAKGENDKRTPLNLVLVLDRSGSMESNDKLTFAKKAIVSVLNLLHDDDVVHLIAYDSDVSVIFENARASSRQYLYPLVDDIETAGSTNISGALEIGAGLLEKYVYEGFARRMFLFSDGQANVGMTRREELTKLVAGYNTKGIITDSFGIGADFDSEVMKGIADSGGARFYFLASSDLIELLVTKALVCVFGVCASRVRLLVRGKNGATVTKIWGHDDLVAGASLGDLFSNNSRSILCEFTTTGAANTDVEVLAYELRYNQPDNLLGEPCSIKNTLSIRFVEDDALVIDVDPRVKIMYASQQASEMDKQIAQLMAGGQRQAAIEVVEKQIQLLKDVEQFDDDKGSVSMLLRLAEHMQKKFQNKNMSSKIISQGYRHQAHLKEECDEADMGTHYLFDKYNIIIVPDMYLVFLIIFEYTTKGAMATITDEHETTESNIASVLIVGAQTGSLVTALYLHSDSYSALIHEPIGLCC